MEPLRHSVAALTALLAAPLAASALLVRPAWRRGLPQRLGRVPRAEPGSIWVHGSSVGEALAAARLLARLCEEGHAVFGSLTTATGRAVLQRVMPDLRCSLAPVDHPWCVEAALARVQPSLLVLVETELWPSLVAATKRSGVPVVVVSGRISDRSLTRYRRLRWLIAPTLRRLDRVGARSELDAERFVALGAAADRVQITGDLKLDPLDKPPRLSGELVRALASVPVFVAGSTHAGEETAALAALTACQRAGREVALVLAPRHLERVDQVEKEAIEAGRVVYRRSALAGARLTAGEVLLLDTLGELPALYAAASVAFVGGTLVPVGGHNLLEPIQAGCPVCFGPHLANVLESARLAGQTAAGTRVTDAGGLGRAVVEILADPDPRARARAGQAALEAHRGSVERCLALVREVLPAAEG